MNARSNQPGLTQSTLGSGRWKSGVVTAGRNRASRTVRPTCGTDGRARRTGPGRQGLRPGSRGRRAGRTRPARRRRTRPGPGSGHGGSVPRQHRRGRHGTVAQSSLPRTKIDSEGGWPADSTDHDGSATNDHEPLRSPRAHPVSDKTSAMVSTVPSTSDCAARRSSSTTPDGSRRRSHSSLIASPPWPEPVARPGRWQIELVPTNRRAAHMSALTAGNPTRATASHPVNWKKRRAADVCRAAVRGRAHFMLQLVPTPRSPGGPRRGRGRPWLPGVSRSTRRGESRCRGVLA